MNKPYPKFISTLPLGEDKLIGNSHKNIAVSISNIIKNQSHEIKKQIIGLEGDWGSGKSNIIKIIQRNEDPYLKNDKYLHFIYDAWGHQEDLNRRALLEELIDFLDNQKVIPVTEEWRKKKSELNGKTITSVKNIFPEIKIFWLFFIFSFLGYNFLNTIYPFLESYDFSEKYIAIGSWKKITSIWVIPTVLFFVGIYFFAKEFNRIITENNKEDKKKKLLLPQILGQIFYLLNGKEIKSNTTDYVIENEPTNKEFRRFLKDINNELIKSDKSLVLTIDNIDRLSREKVKALWSTINIFFAENSESELYDNIWLIIPYDESKIMNSFTENDDPEIGRGLIDKTFAVKFRVTPPLYSNWEQLLESNLMIAFGDEIISDKYELHFIKRIFDNYITDSVIKPRQIINYVNDLVTLRLQYQEIGFRYLALFSLTKNEILQKPIEKILLKSYINDNTKLLFNNDLELDKSISAIVFGVSLENAEEVLLDREIESLLMNGKVEELNKFCNTPSFTTFFEKKFSLLQLGNISPNNIALLPDIFNKIEDLRLIDTNILNSYWSDFIKRLNNINLFDETFYDLHKKIILKNNSLSKSVVNKCVNYSFTAMSNETSEKLYIDKLYQINTFLDEEENVFSMTDLILKSRKITAANYFHLLKIASKNHKDYNLTCDNDDIIKYFYDSDGKLDVRALYTEIDSLILISIDNDFSEIITDLKSGLSNINQTNTYEIKYYYKCLTKLSKTDPFENILISNEVINYALTLVENEEIEVYPLLLIFALKNTQNSSPLQYPTLYKKLQSDDNLIAASTALEIENIISFQKLISMVIDDKRNFKLLKNIIKEIIYNDKLGKKLNISFILKNFEPIKEMVFENDNGITEKFYNKLSGWNSSLIKIFEKDSLSLVEINMLVFDYAIKIDNNISKTLIKKSNEYFMSSDKEDWYEIFNNEDNFSNHLFRKFKNKKINLELYDQKVIPYLIEYLKEFASNKITIENSQFSFLKNILSIMTETDTINFYTSITDCLNNNPNLKATHLYFFIDSILKHNLIAKKPDESVNGVLKILINDAQLYTRYFSTYYKNYIDVIAKSNKNKPFGISILREKLKKYGLKNDMRIYANKKLPNWSKAKITSIFRP
ncbi:KAP family P-loop domain protein [compost metagenome]